MPDPAPTAAPPGEPEAPAPRWGLPWAVGVWIAGQLSAGLAFALYASAKGVTDLDPDTLSIEATFLLQTPLWICFLVAPILITIWRGNGPVIDLGLRMRPVDVPFGVVLGALCQLVLVPLVTLPVFLLSDVDRDELEEAARSVTDRASGTGGVLLLFLMVVLLAPLAEEVFFRGMVQRSLLRLLAPVLAVLVTSLAFGVTHFQLLQLPALIAFGLVLGFLAQRTGRLGPAIWAHVGFNAVTVVVLLLER